MIHALTHKRAYETFLAAETEEKKLLIAYSYFLKDAKTVNKELVEELNKHYEGTMD